MSSCRSCRADVVWVETEASATKAGRKMPLDADPDNPGRALRVGPGDDGANDRGHDDKGLGNVLFTGQETGDGTPIVRIIKARPNLYRSHFATCPNAAAHRRGKR